MFDVADLINLVARYGETSRDLLVRVRPRKFAQIIRTSKHSYLTPFQFLVVSLVISGVSAFTVAAFVLAGSARETLFHIGILGCLAIIAGIWLENLVVIGAAKLAAFALGISAPLSDLLDGYCYASVLFPLFIISMEGAVLGPDQPSLAAIVIAGLVQLVFLGLACVAMTSFVSMHPRYFWRASLGTFLIFIVASYVALATIDQFGRPGHYEVHPLSAAKQRLENSFLAPTHSPPEGECDGATLNGDVQVNDNHDEITVWFEWGQTAALGNITVTQRFTANARYSQQLEGLKENTTYYFRTVGSSKNGSFKGRVFSFTTPHCKTAQEMTAPERPREQSCYRAAQSKILLNV